MNEATGTMMHAPTTLRRAGFFRNLWNWIRDVDDEAVMEEGRQRLRNATNFFDTLPPEALEHLRKARRDNDARAAARTSAEERSVSALN